MRANKKNLFTIEKSFGGFVLLLTLVILVALATLGYVLSSKLLESRSRNQYLIDYAQARYACDSAAKYAMATLDTFGSSLVSRPNEPDFSDLFNMTEPEYQQFLLDWSNWIKEQQGYTKPESKNSVVAAAEDSASMDSNFLSALFPGEDINDFNDVITRKAGTPSFVDEASDSNVPIFIRGPYGSSWPQAYPPVEFEIGTAKITIEFDDENAKYPLGLALLSDEKYARESQASLQTFLRWMWNRIEQPDTIEDSIHKVQEQLDKIKEIKKFTKDFKSITVTDVQTSSQGAGVTAGPRGSAVSPQNSAARGASSRTTSPPIPPAATPRTLGGRPSTPTPIRRTISAAEQQTRQSADFAKIFHSSLIDLDLLARPTIESPTRKESALKYMSLWAATKVNINTAPRQVLESVFVFGGNEKEIADEIIKKRRIKPFTSIDDFKKEFISYLDSIDRCSGFLVTESTFFTVKITAASGAAKISTLIAVSREKGRTQRIAIIAD